MLVDRLIENLQILYPRVINVTVYKELKNQWLKIEYMRTLSITLNAWKHPCF